MHRLTKRTKLLSPVYAALFIILLFLLSKVEKPYSKVLEELKAIDAPVYTSTSFLYHGTGTLPQKEVPTPLKETLIKLLSTAELSSAPSAGTKTHTWYFTIDSDQTKGVWKIDISRISVDDQYYIKVRNGFFTSHTLVSGHDKLREYNTLLNEINRLFDDSSS